MAWLVRLGALIGEDAGGEESGSVGAEGETVPVWGDGRFEGSLGMVGGYMWYFMAGFG